MQIRNRIASYGLVLLVLLAFLMPLPAPMLPGEGVDPSWMLATEHAAKHGLLFGRDFIFTYGPFGFLTSRLYDPQTYTLTILYDFFLTALFLAPLLWHRSRLIVALYAVAVAAIALNRLSLDARVLAALLGMFLVALRSRGWLPVIVAALLAPLYLSKFSYAMSALPLLVLADLVRYARHRQPPLMTAATLLVMLLGMLATGHPLGLLPELAANIGNMIGGYEGAMQSDFGGVYPLLAAAFAILAAMAAAIWLAYRKLEPALDGAWSRWLEPGAALLGIAWTFYVAFKMGHVRQDLHILNTWYALVMAIPMIVAFFGATQPLTRLERWIFTLLFMGSLLPIVAIDAGLYVHRNGLKPLAFVGERATELARRPIETLAWLSPGHWQAMTAARRSAEAELARQLPPGLRGTVDVIPSDLAPAIVGPVTYRPRPVPQSYSSYTPYLQGLDAAHFADPTKAAETVFLKATDIDNRLPTLALGPTLPVLAQWYDARGRTQLGLMLHRRAQPRPMVKREFPVQACRLNEWIAVPDAGDAMMMAHLSLDRTLIARLIAFVGREPMLTITLRFEDGHEQAFRFVPGMAKRGFLISPMIVAPKPDSLRAAVALVDRGFASDAVQRVVAFRLSGGALAGPAFDGCGVAYTAIRLAPGFAARLQ